MNQQAMLRKVRQMQQEMLKTQEEISNTDFTQTAGGVVKVTLKGTNIKGIKTLTLTESGLVLEKNALKKSDSEMKYYKYDGNNENGVLIINGKSYNEAALYVTTNTSKTTYNVFNYEENSEYIKLSDGTTFHKDDFNLKLKDKLYEYCK